MGLGSQWHRQLMKLNTRFPFFFFFAPVYVRVTEERNLWHDYIFLWNVTNFTVEQFWQEFLVSFHMFVSFSRTGVFARAHLSAIEHRRKTVYFLCAIISGKRKKDRNQRKGESGWIALMQLHASTETWKPKQGDILAPHQDLNQGENHGWTHMWHSTPSFRPRWPTFMTTFVLKIVWGVTAFSFNCRHSWEAIAWE